MAEDDADILMEEEENEKALLLEGLSAGGNVGECFKADVRCKSNSKSIDKHFVVADSSWRRPIDESGVRRKKCHHATRLLQRTVQSDRWRMRKRIWFIRGDVTEEQN